ncbi:mannosyl-oligosaccharide 1,2-alpha-mannosidase [Malassezia sp. CBS 17886]|nr:mannosyl-oligosaccharide 1,2-alpha-mannosidase [Malassezia sp. CBS 17886]
MPEWVLPTSTGYRALRADEEGARSGPSMRRIFSRRRVYVALCVFLVCLLGQTLWRVRQRVADFGTHTSPFRTEVLDVGADEGAEEDKLNMTSTLALSSAAFPALIDENAFAQPWAGAYPNGDPHRGELPPVVLALLRSPPPLMPPPPPLRAAPIPAANATTHTWTRAENGSSSTREDALHPGRQPAAPEWRTALLGNWTPPLENLSRAAPHPLPRVQFRFENASRHSGLHDDPARDALIAEHQTLVRSAFIRAWQGYKNYAWGADELRPVSKTPNNNFNGWGATIVDALDTLLVLDLHDEYSLARNHVHDIDFHHIGGSRSAYGSADGRVPVFETAIRYLGGFLSAHDLTGDALMLDRAEELAQLILPAFETRSGVPVGRMRFDDATAYTHESPRGKGEGAVLAEATSMLLEFTRLWQVTGNRTYFDTVQRVTDYLDRNMTSLSRCGTLLPTMLVGNARSLGGKYTFGGQADSYYEYLIKEHQLLDGRLDQYARMYADAINSAVEHLFREVAVVPDAPSLIVATETWGGVLHTAKLEHLGCFAGGMLALGARLLPDRAADMRVARRYTETCWWAYNSSATGLGPEDLVFYRPADRDRYHMLRLDDGTQRRTGLRGNPYVGVRGVSPAYQNRPETIESVLYMWRITGQPVWQERGWQMFSSWMTHALTHAGVSAISDTTEVPAAMTDNMESFTFAETFKYYYLLFSPPELLSFDDFVFTTEAHPFLAPQYGRWAVPGAVPPSLRRWQGPAAARNASAYSGGEEASRGGMTNMQKHDLWQQLHQEAEGGRGGPLW